MTDDCDARPAALILFGQKHASVRGLDFHHSREALGHERADETLGGINTG
ncbi:MAG: hypothetical protein WKF84_09690 [Pyrinomonadaceae bacterium]